MGRGGVGSARPRRAILGGALALALSACAGVVPNGTVASVDRAPDRPARGATTAEPVRSATPVAGPPARRPVAVTPIPALPAAALTEATRARDAGLRIVPALPALSGDTAAALAAFRLSCPALRKRADLSGLTQAGDWDAACALAERTRPGDAARFFATAFQPVQVGDGRLFATGYYEPELAGSRTRRPGYGVPIYRKPADLVEVDLGRFSAGLAGKRVRGRIADGTLVPYPDRAAIEGGALAGRGLEIAWGADPVEVFFLQIQGSGRLRLPDGGVMRIGYAGQNGHDYTSIGRLLVERGVLQSGQASMQGIVGWLAAHPAEGAALMRENESFVFFQELTGPGPLGALGLPVAPRVSVAADPRFVPLGAPVFLSADRADVQGVWIAQDTGGAIKGANRLDTFWGAGDEARAIAGGLSARGTAWILLPRAAAERLGRADR